MPIKIKLSDFSSLFKPGMVVFVQGAVGEPTTLITALKESSEASNRVHYIGCFVPGVNTTDLAALHETSKMTTFFVPKQLRQSFDSGKIRFLPLHYSGICAFFQELNPVDIAMIQVAPPDSDGNCSYGLSVDFQTLVVDRAKCIVAEINDQMPTIRNSLSIPYEKIDYVVNVSHPLIQFDSGAAVESFDKIGQLIADLIEDGDTFQIGIGKVPEAILSRLKNKRNLGIQGGMITDRGMELHQAGVITGINKTYERGKIVVGMALGGEKLYQWAASREDILFRPATITHDVRVISQIENFVSINSVLEVDLTGQANAEVLTSLQVSGTGGLVDFIRGARMSKNGRSILALTSTAGKGKISRIVSQLSDWSIVSCPRADTDYVVTEHGVARLKNKSVDERAAAMISIADPAFRGELRTIWENYRRRRKL